MNTSFEGESMLKAEALVQVLSSTELLIGSGATIARLQSRFQFGNGYDSMQQDI